MRMVRWIRKLSVWIIPWLAFVICATGTLSYFPRTIAGQNCPFAKRIAEITPSTEDDNQFVQCQCEEKKARTTSTFIILVFPPFTLSKPTIDLGLALPIKEFTAILYQFSAITADSESIFHPPSSSD